MSTTTVGYTGSVSQPAFDARRRDAFKSFHRETGLKPYGPEFTDSLIAVMRSGTACLSERVFAWCRWRAWGNSRLIPVSGWENGYPLDQRDCALDLAWFEEGKDALFIEGAPREYRSRAKVRGSEEAPEGMKNKVVVSRAFAKNEDRGTVVVQGRIIRVPPSPPTTGQTDGEGRLGVRVTFNSDKDFMEWWKVARTRNFEAFEVARTAYIDSLKVARSDYQDYLKTLTSGDSILIDGKDLSNKGKQASKQGDVDPVACLPACPSPPAAEATDPNPDPNPASEVASEVAPTEWVECPLVQLRALFPGELIPERALVELDARLAAEYHALYDRDRFIAAVGERQRHGQRIRFGLLQRFEPGYFIRDYFGEEARQARAREEAHRANEEWKQRRADENERGLRAMLDDPTVPEEDKVIIRDSLSLPPRE